MNNGFIPNYQSNYRTYSRAIYNDNLIDMNKGKKVTIYVSFPNSKQWQDIVFKGFIEESNDNYTIIKDINNGKNILLNNKHIDYIIFE